MRGGGVPRADLLTAANFICFTKTMSGDRDCRQQRRSNLIESSVELVTDEMKLLGVLSDFLIDRVKGNRYKRKRGNEFVWLQKVNSARNARQGARSTGIQVALADGVVFTPLGKWFSF